MPEFYAYVRYVMFAFWLGLLPGACASDLMVRGGIVSADNDVSLVAGRVIDVIESRDSIRIQ